MAARSRPARARPAPPSRRAESAVRSRQALPEQLLVAAAVVLTGVVYLSNTADPLNVPKLSALLLCVLLLLGAVTTRVILNRTVTLPWGWPALAGVLLTAGFTLATVVAPQGTVAVLGAGGRNSGLLAYLAALILYFTVIRIFNLGATRVIAFALLLSGLFTATYGFLQFVGLDTIAWNNPFSPIIATLGNPNFASAYLGITASVAVWAALWTGWARGWRVAAALLGLLCLVLAALSYSVQGPVAAAAGLSVIAIAVALNQPTARRPAALRVLGGGAAVGLAALVGLALGPARAAFTGIGFDARTWYWQGAITMWQRSPLTGIGMDSYGLFWRRDRPIESPRVQGGDSYSDAAHSVPLQHLAQGGLLLAAAYLLFLAVVGTALVRGMRRLDGQDRLLLAGLGGAWVAYQVQSLVSIDQVPLLVLNYVLGAAVIVAAGSARTKQLRLPGAPPLVDETRGRRGRSPRSRKATALDKNLVAATAVGVLVAIWFSTIPLRANHAVFVGDVALNAGDGVAATEAYLRAIELVPGLGVHHTRLASALERGNQPQQARRFYEQSFAIDKAEVASARNAGRLAEADGDYQAAERLFAAALQLDPTNDGAVLDWATFQLRHGSAAEARVRLERAVSDLPGVAGLWASLGDAREVLGDAAGARSAYERALQLDPQEPTAKDGLAELTTAP